MKKKNIAKAAAAAFIAANITATVVPVYADESDDSDVTKDESVYTVLNADGSVNEITVSDQLHSENGFNNYDDKSDLKDVQNLKSEDPVKTSKDGFVWNSKDKDIYYQGTSTKDLPMDIKITYTMDGKEATAKSLLGKSGHIQIKIAVDNKQKQTFESNGKKYNLATPFVTVAGAMLDQDKFSNVKINEGTVTSDSSHNIAAAVMIPGLKDGLSSVMDSDIYSAISSYLIDDITIDADVTDFESPTIMLAAATSTDKLKDELGDVDIPDISSQLDQLQDATNQLIDGSQSLYDGAVKLDDGTGTLLNGINALSSGANTLASGADKVSAGAATLQNGLGQLSANSGTLRSGAQQVADGILATANKQLKDAGLEEVTWSNYADKVGEYLGVNYAMRAQARAQILSAVNASGNQVSDSQLDYLLYLAITNNSGDSTDTSVLTKDMQTQGARIQAAQQVATNLATAQTAAKQGVNDPATLTVINGIKASTLKTIEDTAKVDDITAKNVLKYVAANYSTLPGDNLEAKIKNFAATATPMLTKVKAAQIAATKYGANPFSNQTYNYMLSQAGITDERVFSQTIAGIAQAKKITLNEATLLVYYTLNNYTSLDGNGLTGKMQTAGAELNNAMNMQAALTAAGTQDDSTLNNVLYSETINTIKASDVDDSTAALVLAYTANNYGSLAGDTLTAKITSAAAALNDANAVKNAVATASSADGQQTIKGFLTRLVKNDGSYKTLQDANLIDTLNKVDTFVKGVNQYTAGVDSAYAGSKTLASGASQLASGASQLKNGISQLQAGAKTLKSGSDALASGAKSLLDGLNQYNDEAISKLTNNEKITTLQDAADLFTVIEENADDYNNYSGISEGTDGSVKFVYKVEGEKEEKKSNEADDSTKKDNRSFWERVVDLFNFSDLF